jgi:dienelactone hydrolase
MSRLAAHVVILVLSLCVPSNFGLQAQSTSPLWGDLVPGPHRVGFRVMKFRDATRPYPAPAGTAAAHRGYPMVLFYWYPAQSRPAARPMTFRDYQAAGNINDQLENGSAETLAARDADLKGFYERPFNFPFGAIDDAVWARLGPTRLMAMADARPAAGRFPLVVGVGGAGGNQALGEYLASHGYVVALVGSPADVDLNPVAQMEYYVRDLEFALARMREQPMVDPGPVATWGFSFAGMPALLASMRNPDVAAVVSLESAIFYPSYAPQMTGNPFYSPTAVRVPFLHMFREEESRPNENLEGFRTLRYSTRYRYLLNDTSLVHQDFGTHGMAAAVVLEKRPHALAAARLAQRANAEYVRHFLEAYLRHDAAALAWLGRTPAENGFPAEAITLERIPAVTPAPTAADFVALVESAGIQSAMSRFRAARQGDPDAPIFQEVEINRLGYQLMRSGKRMEGIEVFKVNTEFFPTSANTWDSLSEAYETVGDSANAVNMARRTLEVAPAESRLPQATRDNLVRISQERIRRLGGR